MCRRIGLMTPALRPPGDSPVSAVDGPVLAVNPGRLSWRRKIGGPSAVTVRQLPDHCPTAARELPGTARSAAVCRLEGCLRPAACRPKLPTAAREHLGWVAEAGGHQSTSPWLGQFVRLAV